MENAIATCPICGQMIFSGQVCTHGVSAKSVPPPPPPIEPLKPEKVASPRRAVLEILLDPRSIQWMLGCGGLLLVAGMVIWLGSLGIFENPMVVASSLGLGTLLLLLAGWYVIRRTDLHLAGQAVTLLACLIMPLNLWFYNAHHLMTLEGNLWMAAVVCCALYAASALVLRDPLFVYVLMGGVAGTGLLILADLHRFAEIASPSFMLIIMGLIGIHAERAFSTDPGPFSRKKFGLAFYFSGHALLGGGLILLLGAQIGGWIVKPFFSGWNFVASEITTDYTLKLLAIAMVLAGTYAYVYSDLVVRRIGAYVYPAAFTLLWAELLGLEMLNLKDRPELILAAVSFTALLINVVQALLHQEKLARTVRPLAMLLSLSPVVYGVLLYIRATYVDMHGYWPYAIGVGYVGAMFVAAIACRIGAFIHRKSDPRTSSVYFYLTAAATLVGASGFLTILGIATWSTQAPILMLSLIGYLVASRIYQNTTEREALVTVAHTFAIALVLSVLASAVHLTERVVEPMSNQSISLVLALFFAEGAIFYAALAGIRRQGFFIFLSTAMASGAVWQLIGHWTDSTELYLLAFGTFGLFLLGGSKLGRRSIAQSVEAAGHTLMCLSFLSAVLMVGSRLVVNEAVLLDTRLLGLMMLLTLAAAALMGRSSWRRAYLVMTVVSAGLIAVVFGTFSHLTIWRKGEIFAELAGVVMLVLGHIGWFREQDRTKEVVSLNLTVGALLAGVPIFIAAVANRFGVGFSLPDEIGLVTITALMLISGLMLELRATTITGGSLLGLHIAILLGFAGWRAQLAIGEYLSIGGASIFLIGLALAIYRDQLLQLPGKIERKEGLFRVLAWR